MLSRPPGTLRAIAATWRASRLSREIISVSLESAIGKTRIRGPVVKSEQIASFEGCEQVSDGPVVEGSAGALNELHTYAGPGVAPQECLTNAGAFDERRVETAARFRYPTHGARQIADRERYVL